MKIGYYTSYHRLGEIGVNDDTTCDVCKAEHVRCIYIDGSEGEYGGGTVCGACARRMLPEGT